MQRTVPADCLADHFLESIYRAHHCALCTYVRRVFGPGPPEPEDIAQEAFARFAALHNARSVANPVAFLKMTARNLAIDAHRNRKRGMVALHSVEVLTNEQDRDTSDVLMTKEDLEQLAAIVDELRPKQRVAFLLHRIDGLSFVEIARRLQISPSGARGLVSDALEICIARMRRYRNGTR